MRITPNGISFSFDFHHVRRIIVGPVSHCNGFVTRRVHMIDSHGGEVDVTCFSETGSDDIPVRIDEGDEDEEPAAGSALAEVRNVLEQLPNLLRPVK